MASHFVYTSIICNIALDVHAKGCTGLIEIYSARRARDDVEYLSMPDKCTSEEVCSFLALALGAR
jgi:hypothetical protein